MDKKAYQHLQSLARYLERTGLDPKQVRDGREYFKTDGGPFYRFSRTGNKNGYVRKLRWHASRKIASANMPPEQSQETNMHATDFSRLDGCGIMAGST